MALPRRIGSRRRGAQAVVGEQLFGLGDEVRRDLDAVRGEAEGRREPGDDAEAAAPFEQRAGARILRETLSGCESSTDVKIT